MEAYSALAPYYDEFNRDVPYDDILRFYKRLFTPRRCFAASWYLTLPAAPVL